MSTLTARGQTTVPIEVRRHLGLGPRQKILYEIGPDGVRIRAAGKRLGDLAGSLAGPVPALGKAEERAVWKLRRRHRASP